MLLCIDIGNTNITLGAYEDDRLDFTARLATDPARTADQYAAELVSVFTLHNALGGDFDGCMISTVVPALAGVFTQAVKTVTGRTPLLLGPGVKTGLNIKIDDPAQLGADAVASAVAAMHKYPLPCMVFDFGTATKVSVIDKGGVFLGGAICAGLGISVNALSNAAALLPDISLALPEKVVGSNTVDCMQSGFLHGAAAMADGMIDRINEERGKTHTAVITGGLCGEVARGCRREIIRDDNLLLDGLRIIYQKNYLL